MVAAWYISLPLLALQMGMSAAQASGALVVAMIVGALVQFPVGWVSDKVDRRLVLLGLGVLGAASCLAMLANPTPVVIVVGFAVLAGASLPMYAVCSAHANDQLKPSQIVPASGTMVFVLNVGQFGGTLVGPNMVSIADGRGFLIALAALCFLVSLVGLRRRSQEAAPQETGSQQAMAVLGAPLSGVLQADSRVAEEENVTRPDVTVESSEYM